MSSEGICFTARLKASYTVCSDAALHSVDPCSLANLPAAHDVHVLALAAELFPGGHATQSLVDSWPEKCPAGQSVHDVFPGNHIFPGAHGAQLASPADEESPAMQGWQTDPANECWPAAQFVQSLSALPPRAVVVLPAGQFVQTTALASACFPRGQSWHPSPSSLQPY